jgi:predicted HicB family RNase H-like nuclease
MSVTFEVKVVWVDPALHQKVKALAVEQRTSIRQIVDCALREYLNKSQP